MGKLNRAGSIRILRPALGHTASVDVRAELDAPCEPDRLFAWVDDLAHYPRWMRLAHQVDVDDASAEPAWRVELRARIGPMSRSKRLRMVRSDRIDGQRVVFSRDEADGRQHAPWILTADVQPTAAGSKLRVHLHYGGGLWTGGLMERVLADEIERGRRALGELVVTAPPTASA
jgi:Polyketide cyclase / dehydrase and lipid transport